MSRPYVPQTVVDLAHARRDARVRREWAEADGYRAEIEAAGWVVVDRGVDFDLRPARPADVVTDDAVLYGSSESVPSRLGEPDAMQFTVVVVVDEGSSADLGGLGDRGSLILVVNGPTTDADEGPRAAGASGMDVVRLAVAGTIARARNAGIRRATGAIVVLVGELVPPAGTIAALVAALADPAVAIAGTTGLVSTGLPRFGESAGPAVDAVSGIIAFRRADYTARGPLEERFQATRELDIWWSLVLRDGDDDEPPRRAVRVGDDLVVSAATPNEPPGQRRDRYRILDRFGGRTDLISGG